MPAASEKLVFDGDTSGTATITGTTSSSDYGAAVEEAAAHAQRRNVRLTDRKLVEMAVQTANAMDWDELVRLGDDKSSSRAGISGDFEAAVSKTDTKTCVTAWGSVVSSVAEMRSVLRPPTSEAYAATMRELYGSEFIYGTIVHRVGASSDTASNPEHPVRQRRAGVVVTTNTSDVDVRTVTFVKRHLLSRSEQWCFIDALHAVEIGGDDTGEGFAVSMTSLHPDDVFLGKTKASVSAYTNVNVTYTVRPVTAKSSGPEATADKSNRSQVQVVFHAEFEASELSASRPRHMLSSKERMHFWRSVSERALVRRLKEMAANTQHLSRIIRRRRLSAQVFVDERAIKPPNTRCSCCTKMLTTILGRNKKQCHLCGFYVCEQCSQQHEVERGRVRRFIVRICEHCMERVDEGIYDNLPTDEVSSPAIVPDEHHGPNARRNVLGELLQDALLRSSAAQKSAVKAIIRTVAELDTPTSSPSSGAGSLRDASSDDEYLDVLRRLSDLGDSSPNAFALANSSSRKYPTQYKPGAGSDSLPEVPIPDDEGQRLQWVKKTNVSKLKNLPELELICDMARKELGCMAGLVTVATGDEFHVLASNVLAFQNFVNSRENAICAHVLMDKELPILLQHPEADVRFSRQNVVREFGTRFYFGFPLTAADGTAIGAVCCLDSASHNVSQSQYKTMERFARSASRVVQHHAGDK